MVRESLQGVPESDVMLSNTQSQAGLSPSKWVRGELARASWVYAATHALGHTCSANKQGMGWGRPWSCGCLSTLPIRGEETP